jgi:hypothetical protein
VAPIVHSKTGLQSTTDNLLRIDEAGKVFLWFPVEAVIDWHQKVMSVSDVFHGQTLTRSLTLDKEITSLLDGKERHAQDR